MARDITVTPVAVAVHRVDEVKDIRDKAEAMAVSEWVWNARAGLKPTDRGACYVCKKYASLTHAHHVVPLALQAQRDRMTVNHEYVWLCPTHHSAVHVFISAGPTATAAIGVAADIPVDELRIVMDLSERAFK